MIELEEEKTIVEKIKTWQTEDGKVFADKWSAKTHEENLWLRKFVSTAEYDGKALYLYKVTLKEEYRKFIDSLSHLVSYQFKEYKDKKFDMGTVIVAYIIEPGQDYDAVCLCPLSSFIKGEREYLLDGLNELNEIENKYKEI